jgi:hypothetical protein
LHEAGHAAIAWVVGQPVRGLALRQTGGGVCVAAGRALRGRVAVAWALAGELAETVGDDKRIGPPLTRCSRSDLRIACQALGLEPSRDKRRLWRQPSIRRAYTETKTMIGHLYPAIRSIARLLYRRGSLDANDLAVFLPRNTEHDAILSSCKPFVLEYPRHVPPRDRESDAMKVDIARIVNECELLLT